jgi:hypothetical protein
MDLASHWRIDDHGDIVALVTGLREELFDDGVEQLNTFFLDRLIDDVIEDGLKDFFYHFLDVDEARCDLGAVLVCDATLYYITDGEVVGEEDVIEQNGAFDDLYPIAAYGIFGVISQ